MAATTVERVFDVYHWTDRLFSFKTTREPSFRFRNGEFVMIGLKVDGKPLLRAYSIASANYEDHLEFFSIKVADGALTSRLQNIAANDELLVSRKPTGTLVIDDLRPGKRLFLIGTGTGLAPYLSIIRDPDTYERFEQVVLFHGVRQINELAYKDYITKTLPNDEFIGEQVRAQLAYYPSVTRESYINQGRITELLPSGKLCHDLGQAALDPATDRAMVCGSPSMLADTRAMLNEQGFVVSPRSGVQGDYVIERAFVEK